ncbi:MAG: tetratricopeptide repeat protein, partial [Bacteroidales bacterium]|nr:tetratricopeptide repeat protein [Bacteroidales bacterium]
MKKLFFTLPLFFTLVLAFGQQESDYFYLYEQLRAHYNKGSYFEAENYLKSILAKNNYPSDADFRIIYHYAGLVYSKLNESRKSLYYYLLSEDYCDTPEKNPYDLYHNYSARGNLYVYSGDYFRGKSYFGQALNCLQYVDIKNKYYYQRLSAVLLNLGIVLYKMGDYNSATQNYLASLKIKVDQALTNISNVYFNLAKAADRLNEFSMAENYYNLAINTKIEETNDKHPEVADIYTEYGEMLMLVGRYEESLSYLEKALFLFIDIYGIFSTYTTACYQIIGDLYLAQDSCLQSFEYYQKALQSIYPGFVSDEFYDNPSEEGSLRDIRYLEILDKKSYALSKYAIASKEDNSQMDLLEYSLNTTALALKVKEKIRNSYPSQESILFLAEHEKSIYLNGINAAYDLFILSGDSDYSKTAYGFASEWKASELLRKINSREALNNENINDSLYSALNINEQRISQYKNSIFQENQKEVPDSINLFRLKDDLFEASRNYEQDLEIARTQDWYKRMHPKPEPADIAELQRHLSANQSIIEYVLSPRDSVKQNQLYTFV